ncbi:hypothetical protein KP509_01G121000 [Ceratopteris richardii]|uniref:Uncharacterized protein n=1 Tax=Ceratopteris richardii TaxID=49495 RepID=A0A8T2VL16_CERRI|nr:hypothetical protein KP509_01G121000 [Ceratopteris richardii]
MTYVNLAKQRPLTVLPKGIKSGLSQLTLLGRKAFFHTKDDRINVINDTGCKILVRTKYRDVWEGPYATLTPGESTMMRFKLLDPNKRLAILLSEHNQSIGNCAPLLIPAHILASSKNIQIVRSSSHRCTFVSSGSRLISA